MSLLTDPAYKSTREWLAHELRHQDRFTVVNEHRAANVVACIAHSLTDEEAYELAVVYAAFLRMQGVPVSDLKDHHLLKQAVRQRVLNEFSNPNRERP